MARKCDDQSQNKTILEDVMVSPPKGFTDNSPMSYGPSMPIKKNNARKSLSQFSETLDVKPKTDVRRLFDAKSKRKSIISGSMIWYSLPKRIGHKKPMDVLKELFTIGLYNILRLCSLQ